MPDDSPLRAPLDDAVLFTRLAAGLWAGAALVAFSIVVALGGTISSGLAAFTASCVIGLGYWALAARLRQPVQWPMTLSMVLAFMNLLFSVLGSMIFFGIWLTKDVSEPRLIALALVISATAGLLLGRLVYHLGRARRDFTRRREIHRGFEPIMIRPAREDGPAIPG